MWQIWRAFLPRSTISFFSACSCRQFSVGVQRRSDAPIHEHAMSGNLDAIVANLEAEPSVLDVKDSRGWTPLMLAACQGHAHIVRFLVERGCDPALHNRTGQTAAELALFYRCGEAYQLLQQTERREILHNSTRVRRTGIDRGTELRSNSDWMTRLIARESSVFIALHSGLPVGVYEESSGRYRLLRLRHADVKPFIDDGRDLIFLGFEEDSSSFAQAGDKKNRQVIAKTGFEKSAQTNTQSSVRVNDERQTDSKPNNRADVETDTRKDIKTDATAFFAIDLSHIGKADVASLSSRAAIVPATRLVSLRGQDSVLVKQALPLLDWHARHGFCAGCGARTRLAESGYKRVCDNENCVTRTGVHNTSYPRVDPTVICAVVSADRRRCLLARKPIFPPGMFSCVAGFVEPGESLEQACVREVQEEVGVRVASARYHSSQFWPRPSVLMIGYLAYLDNDDQIIQVDETELESARWFERDEIVQMLTLQHPADMFIPPRQAIAHRLIKAWVLESAFDK